MQLSLRGLGAVAVLPDGTMIGQGDPVDTELWSVRPDPMLAIEEEQRIEAARVRAILEQKAAAAALLRTQDRQLGVINTPGLVSEPFPMWVLGVAAVAAFFLFKGGR